MGFTIQGTPTKIEKIGQTIEAVRLEQLELPFEPQALNAETSGSVTATVEEEKESGDGQSQ